MDALPYKLRNDGVDAGADGASAKGESIALELVVAHFRASDPVGEETDFDVVCYGASLDTIAAGVCDVVPAPSAARETEWSGAVVRPESRGQAGTTVLPITGRAQVAAHIALGGIKQVSAYFGTPRVLDGAILMDECVVEETPRPYEIGCCDLLGH
jgi:hypothetical protein